LEGWHSIPTKPTRGNKESLCQHDECKTLPESGQHNTKEKLAEKSLLLPMSQTAKLPQLETATWGWDTEDIFYSPSTITLVPSGILCI